MAVTYPLTFSSRYIDRVTIRPKSVVTQSASPFTGQQQVYKHPGQWWEAEITLSPMLRDDAEEFASFLVKLNGMYGTFLMGDVANPQPRGVATGTPLVKGASQIGDTLVTDGWTPNVTNILKAGDWIQLGSGSGSRLYKVLDNANSDSTGTAALNIWPNLRTSPADNAALTVRNAKGVWRLSANDFGYSIESGRLYGITFACMEAL